MKSVASHPQTLPCPLYKKDSLLALLCVSESVNIETNPSAAMESKAAIASLSLTLSDCLALKPSALIAKSSSLTSMEPPPSVSKRSKISRICRDQRKIPIISSSNIVCSDASEVQVDGQQLSCNNGLVWLSILVQPIAQVSKVLMPFPCFQLIVLQKWSWMTCRPEPAVVQRGKSGALSRCAGLEAVQAGGWA